MQDPFPIPPIPWLSEAIQPLADFAHLRTLPLHVHEIVVSVLIYSFVESILSPYLSSRLFPLSYTALPKTKKLNWNVHVVSLVQSVLINTLALWVMFVDNERKNMNWIERVWGYTGAAGMIQSFATGYFLWDLFISIIHVKVFGIGMLVHAISALIVYSIGFVRTPSEITNSSAYIAYMKQRPFFNFYGCNFILYELSSPFLNFHWFFDKVGMTGSKAQLYNGILLLVTFFCCRLLWGTYQSILFYQDAWKALNYRLDLDDTYHGTPASGTPHVIDFKTSGNSPTHKQIMVFSTDLSVPFWVTLMYLGSNLTLNFLNFYWFRQMIITVRKRFKPQNNSKISEPAANGTVKSEIDEVAIRKRTATLSHNKNSKIAIE